MRKAASALRIDTGITFEKFASLKQKRKSVRRQPYFAATIVRIER